METIERNNSMEIYSNTEKNIKAVVSDIDACNVLVGSMRKGEEAKDLQRKYDFDFVPGLGMKSESKLLEEQANELKEGIFTVLFTGSFSTGKSTLIDALMRKDLLPRDIKPETAIITRIVFGMDEKIIVFKKQIGADGKPLTEEYTVTQFFEKFKVNQVNPDLFSDVVYARLQQSGDGIGGTAVQLVDSPGTSHSNQDTKAAREFAEKASAIVYLINSRQPFTQDDTEYIEKHYANKECKNVFFVFNLFDTLYEDEASELKQNAEAQLRDVFTYDGRFDEEMFQKRVFYTNAYGSLYARLNKPIVTPYGSFKIEDEKTGVPDFEKALGEFLTSDNRDVDALAAYVPKLCELYVNAEKKAKELTAMYEGGVAKAKDDKKALDASIEEVERILEGITASCKAVGSDVIIRVKAAYDNYVGRVASGWDGHFTGDVLNNIPFSTTEMIKLVRTKDEKKKAAAMKPILSAVEEYVESERQALNDEINEIITSCVSSLVAQLQSYQAQLEASDVPIDMEHILSIVGELTKVSFPEDKGLTPNIFQIVLGVIGLDPENIAKGASGTNTNTQAVKNFIVANAIEFVALYIVSWPVGLGLLGVRAWQVIHGWKDGGQEGLKSLLNDLKSSTVDSLNGSKSKLAMEMESSVQGNIIRVGETFAETYRNELAEKQESLSKTIADLENSAFNLGAESKRMSSILSALAEKISHVNELTGRGKLSVDMIKSKA